MPNNRVVIGSLIFNRHSKCVLVHKNFFVNVPTQLKEIMI